ncbi:MAG: DUF445 family protein [Actinobacteria bacterium]|nr:DUF445 family protein [Actinomycetota bacterium]
MDILYYVSVPLIGAAIGWFTNWVAVKLLFRPQRPVNILGYTLQGVVPKRRDELARSIGKIVENELLSVDDLVEAVKCGDTMDRIAGAVSRAIRARITDRIPVFVPVSVKRTVSDIITDQLRKDIPAVLEESLARLSVTVKETVSLKAIVEEKVNNFSLDRLEQVVLSVSARELKHIEILGGVLGFLIGLAQVGILYLSGL